MTTSPETAVRPCRRQIVIKIIGVGGAGATVVQQLQARGLANAAFAVMNTEPVELSGEYFPVDARHLRSVDATAESAMAEQLPRLQAWCVDADVVFIVAGLGGKAGTTLSPLVARYAKESGALTLAFVAQPFDCEGSRRQQQARAGLNHLKAVADGVVCLPNQKILKLIDENTSLLETFKISGALLADGVQGGWQLLSYRGLIEIHFDEFRDLLRDGHTESLYATAEAAGPNRSREIVDKLLAHPLLDGGRALADAGGALVSIVGGAGLTMAEINRVMEQINRQCENAQVLMSAAIDETFGDRLAVTVIATLGEPGSRLEVNGTAPGEIDLQAALLNPAERVRPASRFVPPPPALSPEKMEELAARRGGRSRKGGVRMRQEQLPLEVISKGRFDKSEPTIYKGEDLDQPTYIRRGMVLN